jgi:hypothetical protein
LTVETTIARTSRPDPATETAVNRDPAGLRCPCWSRRRGLKRAQVKLYRAADCSASTPPAPRREWTGGGPARNVSVGALGIHPVALVVAAHFTPSPLWRLRCTWPGSPWMPRRPSQTFRTGSGSGGLHGQVAGVLAPADPDALGLPADEAESLVTAGERVLP